MQAFNWKHSLGIFLLLAGITTNKWFLAKLLTADGTINDLIFTVAIFGWNFVLIISGLLILLRPRKKLTNDFTNLTLSISTFFFALVFLELFLHIPVVANNFQPFQRLQLFKPNESNEGFSLRPNLDIQTNVGDTTVYIKTNSHGMRWRPVRLKHPQTRKRVAFLGDSHTFGMWATQAHTSFVGIFEKLIQNEKYQVLNFGVPAFSVVEMRLLLREKVLQFNPDIVFLIIYTGNDFQGTYLGVERIKEVYPEFVRDTSVDVKKIPPEYRPSLVGFVPWMKKNLRSLRTYRLLDFVRESFQRKKPQKRNESMEVDVHFNTSTFMSRKEYPSLGKRALQATLNEVRKIRKIVQENNAILLLATMPSKEQVYVKKEEGPDYSVWLPQNHIRKFARKHQIPFVDVLPKLRKEVSLRNSRLFVPHDSHLNNLGHSIVGAELARFFNQKTSKDTS